MGVAHPVRVGVVEAIGPARDHVAQVHHEAAFHRRGRHPGAVGHLHLQAAMAVLRQDGDGAPVGVGACAKGALVGPLGVRGVADHAQRHHGLTAAGVEIIFGQAQRKRHQLHQPDGEPVHRRDIGLALGVHAGQLVRPLARAVGLVAGQHIGVVGGPVHAAVEAFLEVGGGVGVQGLLAQALEAAHQRRMADRQGLAPRRWQGHQRTGGLELLRQQGVRHAVVADVEKARGHGRLAHLLRHFGAAYGARRQGLRQVDDGDHHLNPAACGRPRWAETCRSRSRPGAGCS